MTDIDRSTIDGLLRGEGTAYTAVIKTLQGPVYRFALRLCGSSSAAEDITQETFLAVWQGIGSFRWKSRFTTWVFGIAYRQVLRRQEKRDVETVNLEEWHEDDASDLCSVIHEADECRRIRRTVYALPNPYREAVCLVQLEGLSYREAAEVLQVPVGTVKSRMNCAFKLLRERLESEAIRDEMRESESLYGR